MQVSDPEIQRLVEPVSKEQMRQAALSGEILNLVKHVAAKAGDVIFIPAGTVHALGKGISLLEIQQQSDITYRLYDYGRGRELHLDKGIEVSQRGPAGKTPQPVRLDGVRTLLASCKYFVTEEWKLTERFNPPPVPGTSHVLIFLGGECLDTVKYSGRTALATNQDFLAD